ncbi:hypothetical protein [Amycolatopsis orientalis]|uniref:hypothetical protein n=1 Tax=Amycolatopsis orientalis TaxID=31958 RepID=UPI00040BFE16|nr:hypothetical protein [Amycolatopsis orientalis]
MARIDIVHDAQGNVLGFSVPAEDQTAQTGVKAQEGQTVTPVDVPGDPSKDPHAFAAAVHTRLRGRLQD